MFEQAFKNIDDVLWKEATRMRVHNCETDPQARRHVDCQRNSGHKVMRAWCSSL